jgi:hypothetical protein
MCVFSSGGEGLIGPFPVDGCDVCAGCCRGVSLRFFFFQGQMGPGAGSIALQKGQK